MAYSLGPVHDLLSGSGSVTVASPSGLLLEVSQIPSGVSVEWGTPTFYRGIGRVTPADAHGWFPNVPIHYVQQLVYPLAAPPTLVGYDLVYGMGLKLTELVGDPGMTLNQQKQPWDRAAAAWQQSANVGLTGPGNATAWSYTVPTGKKLCLSQAQMVLLRSAAAAPAGLCIAHFYRNGIEIMMANSLSNVVGEQAASSLSPGPLYMQAGETLSMTYFCNDTGGSRTLGLYASGFVFDA